MSTEHQTKVVRIGFSFFGGIRSQIFETIGSQRLNCQRFYRWWGDYLCLNAQIAYRTTFLLLESQSLDKFLSSFAGRV